MCRAGIRLKVSANFGGVQLSIADGHITGGKMGEAWASAQLSFQGQPLYDAAQARKVLDDFGTPHTGAGTGPTHIFNLGHGISQHTPPEHVRVLVDTVHAHSRHMRGAPSA